MKNKRTSGMVRKVACIAGMSLVFFSMDAGANDASPIGHFEITRYDVQGNTLLAAEDIDQMLVAYTGKEKNFGSVQMALETLETAYREKGYDVVRVVLPEQELNRGVVVLKVVEYKLGVISVSGNQYFSDTNIKNSLPTLQSGQMPVMRDVSANLKVANENPFKKTTVQLQNGDNEGFINASLKVEDQKPWSVSVGVDDTGDNITGRNRLTMLYQNGNIGGLDHVLSMQYTTSLANPEDVNVYGIGYHIPLYALSDSVDLYASYSNVNSGTVTAGVFDLAVSGSGTVAGIRYNHNILKAGNYDSTISGGIDYKIFNNDLSIAGFPIGGDVVVHPAHLTYAGNWAVSEAALNFSMSFLANIPGGNNSSPADFSTVRTDATPDYRLLRFGATFLHDLPHDWKFRFNLTGQQTSDALVPGEQFGIGGADSVRGFTEREVANDKGRTTNLELYTPKLCSGYAVCRLLVFYDTGYVARNDPLPGEIEQESIGSVGLGFRLTRGAEWLFQTDVAHVVDASTMTEKGANRIDFRLVYTF